MALIICSYVLLHLLIRPDCAKQQGLAVKAEKGDALLFFSVMPDGNTMDELSLHASCPVLSGNKFVATKWLRH